MKMYLEQFGWIEDNRQPDEEPRQNHGEYLLKDYFRAKGHKVIDVSDNKQFFEPDIDLVVQPVKGDTIEPAVPIEVKYDTRINQTGNLFVEYHHDSISQGSQPGWFYKCQADLLCYMDAWNKVYYVFKVKDFRQYIKWNQWKYRQVSVPDTNKYGEYGRSYGWLIPLKELQQNIKVQTIRLN